MLGLKFADCARLSVIDRHQAEGRGLTNRVPVRGLRPDPPRRRGIIVATSVTATVTDVTPTVTEAVSVTVTPAATIARRSMTPVKLAAFAVARVLASVSAAFSIDGLTAIFAGAFWPVITMGGRRVRLPHARRLRSYGNCRSGACGQNRRHRGSPRHPGPDRRRPRSAHRPD